MTVPDSGRAWFSIVGERFFCYTPQRFRHMQASPKHGYRNCFGILPGFEKEVKPSMILKPVPTL